MIVRDLPIVHPDFASLEVAATRAFAEASKLGEKFGYNFRPEGFTSLLQNCERLQSDAPMRFGILTVLDIQSECQLDVPEHRRDQLRLLLIMAASLLVYAERNDVHERRSAS